MRLRAHVVKTLNRREQLAQAARSVCEMLEPRRLLYAPIVSASFPDADWPDEAVYPEASEGREITFNISIDPGADTLSSVTIYWLDGSSPTVLDSPETEISLTHVLADSGNWPWWWNDPTKPMRLVEVSATNSDDENSTSYWGIIDYNIQPSATLTATPSGSGGIDAALANDSSTRSNRGMMVDYRRILRTATGLAG